ncbi:hypothetical protein AVDCRST_MAG84-2445 [uncultured Microcoleus sp.]|uniref:Uncharacterized protein n=1 Tax=uncultured Microcoleus sp. TaxID=259945 RepID=A0A6J4LVS3_9CYAN|nr:hypothetical protein AVDCRST_MAG84-2445 [uncultured Microcoleus sp.]
MFIHPKFNFFKHKKCHFLCFSGALPPVMKSAQCGSKRASPFCRNPSDRVGGRVFAELELRIQSLVNAMRGRIVNGCYL